MSTLSLPAAASHLGVPVRVLRRAIRMGTVPAPAKLNALSLLSQEWFASVQLAVVANPKAFKVFPQKVPAFARYEGTSCFRKYRNRVREFNAHKASVAA
jgi:hypothetical protein